MWAAAFVVAGALVLGACAGSGFHYVKDSDDRTYFKVPESWKLYDNDSLLEAAEADLSDDELEQLRETQWMTVFDGHPSPALSHVVNTAPKHPVGRAIVQTLSPESADSVSMMLLRNIFYDVDKKLEKQKAEIVTYEPVERDGGFRGSHLVVKLITAKGDVMVNQIVLLDQATTKMYGLLVTCASECYDASKSKIEQVMDSWTVEES